MNYKKFGKENEDWITYETSEGQNQVIFYDANNSSEDNTFFIIDKNRYYLQNLSAISISKQDKIMDFLNQEPDDWFNFKENVYNIILGQESYIPVDVFGRRYGTYVKCKDGSFRIESVSKTEFLMHEYKFTESQLNKLKKTLPENMRKIVDLAKVKVGTTL